MSSPGAGSFSTLSSYASSASDHQGQQHAIGHPLPAATQPTTTRTTTTLPPVSPSSTTNATNFLTNNNSSTSSNNINNNNNTPNLLGPTRTATINFNLLPELETGLDINRLNYLCKQEQQSIITTTSTDKHPEEEEEPEELGWKDAYEVMIKVPLQGLAAWARRWRRVRTERGQGGMV